MHLKLRDEDRRAMDLLLDRPVAPSKAADRSAYAAVDGLLGQRVAHIEKVLSLLDYIPVTDPPRHLLHRTLRLVKDSSGRDVTIPNYTSGSTVASQSPHA